MATGTLLQAAAEAAVNFSTSRPPVIRDLVTPDCWHQWAVGYSKSGEYLRAAVFFRHAIVLNPHHSLLRFDFGVALVKAELFRDACFAFEERVAVGSDMGRTAADIAARIGKGEP